MALSDDLRERVVEAVVLGGLSRNAAARRFGVSIASAVRWVRVYDRPMNAALFEEWVEKCLVPALSQGDIVVMDNLPAHKGARVEQLIKSAGAELRYLPPYSPDMNPIEKAFSKLKAYLRKIAERTVAGLMRRSMPVPTSSNLPNAQITSPPAAMIQLDPEFALADRTLYPAMLRCSGLPFITDKGSRVRKPMVV